MAPYLSKFTPFVGINWFDSPGQLQPASPPETLISQRSSAMGLWRSSTEKKIMSLNLGDCSEALRDKWQTKCWWFFFRSFTYVFLHEMKGWIIFSCQGACCVILFLSTRGWRTLLLILLTRTLGWWCTSASCGCYKYYKSKHLILQKKVKVENGSCKMFPCIVDCMYDQT